MRRYLFSLAFASHAAFAQKLEEPQPAPKPPTLNDDRYERILRNERVGTQTKVVYEDIAAGAAALTIGLYGYYNDHRGPFVKFAYTATQTAGVYMISDAILRSTKPSLLLLSDRHLRSRGVLSYSNYKKGVVSITRRIKSAETKKTAYTTGILSLTNAYAAYRERNQKSVKNIFTFLSANFFFISTISFYQLYQDELESEKPRPVKGERLEARLLPYPTLTYFF